MTNSPIQPDDLENDAYDPKDREQTITTGGEREPREPEPLPEPIRRTTRPEGSRWIAGAGRDGPKLELPVDGLSPTDQEIPSSAVVGPMDGWLGRVDEVAGAAVHVRRVGVEYQTNNEPAGHRTSLPHGNLTPTTVKAWPWPARHDQAGYIAAADDIVLVIAGRDGKHWYLSDDLPFPAMVIADGGSTDEDNAGGAGLLHLKVRRLAMSGHPSGAVPTLGALQTAASANVEIDFVKVMAATNTHHGYRCGNLVWVQRRGLYYYAVAATETFTGYLVDAGKAGEADHVDSVYHVREYDSTIAYSTDEWSAADANRTLTAPNSAGGRFGRWVSAQNVAEWPSGTHLLNVVADPGDTAAVPAGAIRVTVSMYADPVTSEVGYVFYHKPLRVIGGATTVDEVTSMTFVATNDATVTVTDDGNGALTVTIDADAVAHNLLGTKHTDTVVTNPAEGDLVLSNTTPKWDVLPIRASDEVLTSEDGTAVWQAIPFVGNTGIDVQADKWVDANADGTYTLSTADWRGREYIGAMTQSFGGTTPPAWDDVGSTGTSVTGYIPNGGGSDFEIVSFGDGSGNFIVVLVDNADGHLELVRQSGWTSGRTQVVVKIFAGVQKADNTPDISSPDP